MRLGMTFLNRGRQWLIVESGYPYINLFWCLHESETQFQPSHAPLSQTSCALGTLFERYIGPLSTYSLTISCHSKKNLGGNHHVP